MTKHERITQAQELADYTNEIMVVGQLERGDEYFVRPAIQVQPVEFSYLLVVRPTGDTRYNGMSAAEVLAANEYDYTTQEQPR